MPSPGPHPYGAPSSAAGPTDAPSVDPLTCWGRADNGAIVEITVHPTLAGALDERWPPRGLARCDRPDGPAAHSVTVLQAADDGGPRRGWDRLESELALFAAEHLHGLVAVHAAVILHGANALLLPGASGTGKSTLCVAAAAAGATVLTDEYALVDPGTGLVSGWLRPVRIRRAGGGTDRVDIATAAEPVRVTAIAFVAHAPGSDFALSPFTGAEAVLGLLANTVCARSRSDEALDAALALARTAPAMVGVRGDAAEAIGPLLALTTPPDPAPA